MSVGDLAARIDDLARRHIVFAEVPLTTRCRMDMSIGYSPLSARGYDDPNRFLSVMFDRCSALMSDYPFLTTYCRGHGYDIGDLAILFDGRDVDRDWSRGEVSGCSSMLLRVGWEKRGPITTGSGGRRGGTDTMVLPR